MPLILSHMHSRMHMHTKTTSWVKEWSKIIRLKMINAPFCPSWHLEHICPAGTRTDTVAASGIKPPFALRLLQPPEAAGKGSCPAVRAVLLSSHPSLGETVGVATPEFSTLRERERWYLWCGNRLLFIQRTVSVKPIHRIPWVSSFSSYHRLLFNKWFSNCPPFLNSFCHFFFLFLSDIYYRSLDTEF